MNKKEEKTVSATQAGDAGIVKMPIEFRTPDNVLNHFSNFTIVQHDPEHETFTMSFYEVQKPPFLGSKEEVQKQLKEFIEGGKKTPAICVSRVVFNPSHFKKMVAMLQKHVEAFEKRNQTRNDDEISAEAGKEGTAP